MNGIQLSDPPAQWELEVLRAIGLAPAHLNALRAIEDGQIRGCILRTDPHFAPVRELIRQSLWVDGDLRWTIDQGCEVRGLTREGRGKLLAAEIALAARQDGRRSTAVAGFLRSCSRWIGGILAEAGRLTSNGSAAAFVGIRIGAVALIVGAGTQSPILSALLCAHGHQLLSEFAAESECILLASYQHVVGAGDGWYAREQQGNVGRLGSEGYTTRLSGLAEEW